MSESGNKAQIEYWNSDVGRRWAGHQKTIDAMLHGLAELLLEAANIQPGERILDIGCGSGTTTLAVAERVGPSGSVLGVDVSEPMLSLARERVVASGLRNIELVASDAATFPFEPRRFDRAISRLGVMFFADPAGAFANIRRAMRPGAPLVFVCFRALAECPWFGVPFAAARPHLTAQPPADPDAPGPFAFARAERVAGILSDAGFSDIRLTAADPVMRSGDLDQAVTTALRFGPVARALGDADQEQRRAVEQAVRAALAERETADGVRLSAGVWLVSAAA